MQTRHTNFGVKYSRDRLYATMWKCCYISFQLITKCQTHTMLFVSFKQG